MPYDPKTGRPIVGPADPATRNRLLREYEASVRTDGRNKLNTGPKRRRQGMTTVPEAYRLLKNRGKQIDKAVDDNS